MGNGKQAFFWHDNWLRSGKLIDITGATCTRYLGVARSARVCDAVSTGQWRVRGQRSRNFHELHHKIQLEPVPNNLMANDQFLWRHEAYVYKDSFNASKTWEQIPNKWNGVSWSSSVWFSQGIPRYAFKVRLVV